MYACVLAQCEHLRGKLPLHQHLAAGERHAAAFAEEHAVAQQKLRRLLGADAADIAAAGQASTQRPHSVQRVLSTWMRSPSVSAHSGQAFTQPPHRTHVCGLCQSAGLGSIPSGF